MITLPLHYRGELEALQQEVSAASPFDLLTWAREATLYRRPEDAAYSDRLTDLIRAETRNRRNR